MASRWAFEAFMVTQFKDNPFEKQFYTLDQKEALAKYKKIYYLPALESELSVVINNRNRWRDKSESNPVKQSLDLLRSELQHELSKVGEDRFPYLDRLQLGKFDSLVYHKTDTFLHVLRKYYDIREQNAIKERDAIIAEMTDTPGKLDLFNLSRMKFQNESVQDMVESRNVQVRIAKWKGELIQKTSTIYFDDHRPAHMLDFRANFYVPVKYFGGKKYDTFYFNIAVIWFFSLTFYIALYFQWLKKLVNGLEAYRKYRSKD
ncbi:MAG: hypothetical protein HC819_24545 [Cyclobacteriaceae bacterium]|nr:hypothetical protein [Cyclobacteriaceae bacterium]